MPVSILFCEGKAGGPDVRILGKLLAGRCELRPSGGKYGLGSLIKGARATIGNNVVFGILDRDFPDGWGAPMHRPMPWIASDQDPLGWRWERKEIENYLTPEFTAGGKRHTHYLTAFAGKDLLWSLDEDLRGFGFKGVLPFQEKVLMGIQKSADDIGAWLPEWKALQDQVEAA